VRLCKSHLLNHYNEDKLDSTSRSFLNIALDNLTDNLAFLHSDNFEYLDGYYTIRRLGPFRTPSQTSTESATYGFAQLTMFLICHPDRFDYTDTLRFLQTHRLSNLTWYTRIAPVEPFRSPDGHPSSWISQPSMRTVVSRIVLQKSSTMPLMEPSFLSITEFCNLKSTW